MERKFVTPCLSILGAATLCSCGSNAEPIKIGDLYLNEGNLSITLMLLPSIWCLLLLFV